MINSSDMLDRDFDDNEELEGQVFELYEKTPNREFKSHVQFIKADSLCVAEDIACEADPDYWRTKSVRAVDVEYIWETFTRLHYSYSMAKSVLGIDDMFGDTD